MEQKQDYQEYGIIIVSLITNHLSHPRLLQSVFLTIF